MSQQLPRIEVVPVRPAVRTDSPTTLDVLLKIVPPNPTVQGDRPPLNLGLVIDRSGSMNERNKMTFARDAAIFVVNELTEKDRVSITLFDDKIETIAPNAPVTDKPHLIQLIEAIQPRDSTDLHAGWAAGGEQVASQPTPGGLNRVLLLSDGQANAGETRPDEIATRVHNMHDRGVGTSTFGVGDSYNENLLESMARSGDGNYYYIESANQMPLIFGAELRGLSATFGTDVSLAVEPADGVTLSDALNDFTMRLDGKLQLPNLIAGLPVYVVLRFEMNESTAVADRQVARFMLNWLPAKSVDRLSVAVELAVPVVTGPEYDDLPSHPEVQERAVLLTVARHRKEATVAADANDILTTRESLLMCKSMLSDVEPTQEILEELQALERVQAHLDEGDTATFSKKAKYHNYQRSHSKPYEN